MQLNELFWQYMLGILMFSFTTILLAALTTTVLMHRHWVSTTNAAVRPFKALVILAVGLSVLMGSAILQTILWALLYLKLGAFGDFYKSLFFSMSCFTTLGFTNFLPDQKFVILAALEGVSGSLNMGWTGGIILSLIQSLYRGLENEHEARYQRRANRNKDTRTDSEDDPSRLASK